jgi:hypothetical protein
MIAAMAALIASIALGGCAQPGPAASAPLAVAPMAAPDERPRLVFTFGSVNEELPSARVLVNGIDVGTLGDFAFGSGALRVSAGTHRISVTFFDRVLLEQTVTVADGERRTLSVR